MKFFLIKVVLIFFIFFFNSVKADNFNAKYTVSTSGLKIGEFSWSLKIKEGEYNTKVTLKNSGLFSPIYKFTGQYVVSGIIEKNKFKTKEYKQYWKTNKKTKIVEMSFNNYLTKFYQSPDEKELPRLDLYSLSQYFDPITSFINILNGSNQAKTIDGRRIYIMERNNIDNSNNISLKIKEYQNIWADHKRNDLDKIEFYLENVGFFPKEIYIYFKKRIFKLKKI